MPLPNEAFNADAVPFGGIFVTIKRPTNVANPDDNPTTLGEYAVESGAINRGSIVIERPEIDGGDGEFLVVHGPRQGNAVIQLATATTPTLQAGDFFDLSDASIASTAAGAAVSLRCVIINPDTAFGPSYRTQSVGLRVKAL